MKNLFLLFLALTCFRFSYGEDLSSEQQRKAWLFISQNLLGDDYLPNIFEDDIILNLKESATTEDSIMVLDIIKSIDNYSSSKNCFIENTRKFHIKA